MTVVKRWATVVGRALIGAFDSLESLMKRALMVAAVPAAFAVASFVGVAPASAHDFDCGDFRTMADAQDHYNADTSDPDGLDGPPGPTTDGQPGVACENFQEYPQPGNPAIYGEPMDATTMDTTTTTMTTGTSAPMPMVGAESTTAPMPVGPVATGFGGTAPQPSDAPSPLLIGGAASLLAGLALVAGGLKLRHS